MVAQTPRSHRQERAANELQPFRTAVVALDESHERHERRELLRGAETAVCRIGFVHERPVLRVQNVGGHSVGERAVGGWMLCSRLPRCPGLCSLRLSLRGFWASRQLFKSRSHLRRDVRNLLSPLLPRVGNSLQDHGKRRLTHARLRWEIGAQEERHPVGIGKCRQGPATVTAHGLQRVHVLLVDGGEFLAIDLDRNEVLVDLRCDCRVTEGLPCHDVTPVTGGVADRHHDRHIAPFGLCKSLRAPRIPVDRLVGVGTQVRRGRPRQTAGVSGASGLSHPPALIPGALRRP